MNDIDKAIYLANEAKRRGIYLCDGIENWTKVCMSLSDLGEPARPIFHMLAVMAPKPGEYIFSENERKFTNCLHTTRDTHFATFIFMCEQNGIELPKGKDWKKTDFKFMPPPPMPKQPLLPPTYISVGAVVKAHQRYKETPLYTYLCNIFPTEAVDEACEKYQLCASNFMQWKFNRLAVSFPYQSVDGLYIDCKVMPYDPVTGSSKFPRTETEPTTGDEEKKYNRYVTWAITQMQNKEKRASGKTNIFRDPQWCNFGDHLLKGSPETTVCIVESEKTAMILDMYFHDPSRIWIAVGGIMNINADRFEPYRGRKIVLFPDRNGADKWEVRKGRLHDAGFNVALDTTILDFPGEEGDDLADVVIRIIKGTQEPPVKHREQVATPSEEPVAPAKPAQPALNPIQSALTHGMVRDIARLALLVEKNPNIGLLVDKLHFYPKSLQPLYDLQNSMNHKNEIAHG